MEVNYSDLKFVPVYESSTAAAIREMVIKGSGVAWIPKSVIAADLKNRTLVRAASEDDDILLYIVIYRYLPNAIPNTENFWQILLQKKQMKLNL